MKKFNIIGHRGLGPTNNTDVHHSYPENTLAAFQYALDNGADGIELDVLLTKDGQAVVIHDQRLHDHVIPEQYEAASRRPVGEYTYDELQEFDLRNNQKIPTLREVFQLVGHYHERKIINLDVKDIHCVDPVLDNAQQMQEALRTHHIVVSSYKWDILRAFRRQDQNIHLVPAIKSALLFGADNVEKKTYRPLTKAYQSGYEIPVIDLHREINAYAFDCAISDFTPSLITLAKSQNVGLQLSTGNTRVDADSTDYKILDQLKRSTEEGVPFVICKVDEPNRVMRKMNLG